MGRLIVFPFGSSTLAACTSLSLLSISCIIFPIFHLLLGASSLIWTICPTIEFIIDLILGCCRHVWYCSLKLSRYWLYQRFQNSFRCDCPFSKFPVIHWLTPSVVKKSGFPSSSSIGTEFLGFKHKKWFGVIASVNLISSSMYTSGLELSLCSHSIVYVQNWVVVRNFLWIAFLNYDFTIPTKLS